MNIDRIRALNDAFRTTGLGGRFMLTAGVNALKAGQVRAAVAAVKSFDKFEEAPMTPIRSTISAPSTSPASASSSGRSTTTTRRSRWAATIRAIRPRLRGC
jgi:hypothetical protein